MALLKEDNTFTHVIAIDFGTGASGYYLFHSDTLSLPGIQTKMAKFALKSSIPVMEVTIKKPQQPFFLTMMATSLTLESMHFKNMLKLLKMETQQCYFKM